MSRQLTVTAYRTELDYESGTAEHLYEDESNELAALETHDNFVKSGYWLVTTTNEEGKLIQ